MKKAENTGNYIDISFSNKRNNVFLLLLYKSYYLNLVTFAVAPLAGAWVEIRLLFCVYLHSVVAPLAGAWVEILVFFKKSCHKSSLPSRERGLKYQRGKSICKKQRSLPSRERGLKYLIPYINQTFYSRSPRGSVG